MQKMAKKRDKDPSDIATPAAGKVSVVAQELKFAKMLASNDVKIRNGVLKSLKKWLNTRSQSSYRKYLLIAVFFVTDFQTISINRDIRMVNSRKSFTIHEIRQNFNRLIAAHSFYIKLPLCHHYYLPVQIAIATRKKVHGHPINPPFYRV